MHLLVGDTIYFSASDGSTGEELWAHDTSNHSTWQVADIRSGSGDSQPGRDMYVLIGDTLYFSANDGSTGYELWAHDTSNHSTWRVADINSGNTGSEPGTHMSVLVGDTIYFDCNTGTYDWQRTLGVQHHQPVHMAGGWTSTPVQLAAPWRRMAVARWRYLLLRLPMMEAQGDELWAHDTSNHSTWRGGRHQQRCFQQCMDIT